MSAQKAKNPARLDDFVVRVESPVELTGAQRTDLEQEVSRCLVHATLLHPPRIRLEFPEAMRESLAT